MPRTRPAHAVLAVTAMLLVLALGCSKGAETAAPPGTQAAPTSTVPVSAQPASTGPDCTVASLTPVAQAKYAGATLGELVCGSPFAATTIRGGAGLAGDGVGLFRLTDGVWVLVASGAAADAKSVLPPDFSTSIFNAWKAKYQTAIAPPTTPAPAGAPTSQPFVVPGDGSGSGTMTCQGDQSNQTCTSTPTVPVTTPDGSPVPTTAPKQSQFCYFNYNDPRCKADPSFTE